jgi:hypothetical protein
MAFHYTEPGTVPIILGAVYSRWPANSRYSIYSHARLTLINEGTGCGKMHAIESGYAFYVSLAELSRYWHLIRRV